MNQLESLLKQKSFSELTQSEKDFVLQHITADDYTAERKIILLSKKLKQQQNKLQPNEALKTQLMNKIAANNKSIISLNVFYRIAACFFIGISVVYFFTKNSKTTKNEAVLITQNKLKTHDNLVTDTQQNNNLKIKTIKKVTIKKTKTIRKNKPNYPIKPNYEDMEFAFAPKKTNFEWQEDEEEKAHEPTLRCSDK